MKLKEIIVHTYRRDGIHDAEPIITVGFKEHTHIGTGGFVFSLTPAEADELQGKIRAALSRAHVVGGSMTRVSDRKPTFDEVVPLRDNGIYEPAVGEVCGMAVDPKRGKVKCVDPLCPTCNRRTES